MPNFLPGAAGRQITAAINIVDSHMLKWVNHCDWLRVCVRGRGQGNGAERGVLNRPIGQKTTAGK